MQEHLYHCPNCGHTGQPARPTSVGSVLVLLSPLLVAFQFAIQDSWLAQWWWAAGLAWVPFAFIGALAVRGRACPACGWRHIRPATAEEQGRSPAA